MFPDIARDDVFHLETPRLWLRWPRASDAAAIHRYCSKREVAELTARIPHPYPPGSAERFIFAAREGNASGRDLTLVMTPIKAKRDPIGAISLEMRGLDRLSLGYALTPEAWGKGFGSEAVEAMVDAAFTLTKTVAIHANVFVSNLASRRVLEKAGFRLVGTGPEGAPARGGLVESDKLVITRAEWTERRELAFAAQADRAAETETNHEVP